MRNFLLFLLSLLVVICCTPFAFAESPNTFTSARYGAATAPRAIASADFDRDGYVDLATAGRDGVSILLNVGGRSFTSRYSSARGGGAFDLAAGDLNHDAIPDLVVAQADGETVDIYTGHGDGTFADPQRVPITGGNPRGVTLVDYDLDGTLDIIVTEYATGKWRVLYGDGRGSISHQDRLGSIANPQGVVAADFNRDGRPDVAIAAAGINRVALFLSTTTGVVQRNVTVGAAVNVLSAGDFNGDGWLDLAAASTSHSRIYTVLGGAGGLAWNDTISSGSSPRGIVATDVNQDGHLDLMTANRASNTVNIHLGTGSGTFSAAQAIPAGSGSRDLTAADFDHDGRIDLATIDEFRGSATVLTNTTPFMAPAFRFAAKAFDANPGLSGPFGVETGDFDRDGRLDTVVWGIEVDMRLAAGSRTTVTTAAVNDVTVADFNGDGAPDLAATDYFGRSIPVFINRGDGTFREESTGVTAAAIELAAGDFNGDGHADIVYQVVQEGTVQGVFHVLLGHGDGTFSPTADRETLMPFVQKIELADIDRDGHLDIVGASGSPSNVVVWYGKGDGTASRLVLYPMPRGISDIAVGDVNEDGIPDVVSAYDSWVYVRLGQADGSLAEPTEHLATLRGDNVFVYDIGLGDVDLDGHLDIVTNDADILFGNGDGSFRFDARSGFDGYYQDPRVVDDNGDGLPDLVFNEGGGLIVLLGERGGTNHPPVVSAGPDLTVDYVTVNGYGEDFALAASGSDPDLHELRYEWRDEAGTVVGTSQYFVPPHLPPGSYAYTVTGYDGRGAQSSDSMVLTVRHLEEVVLHWFNFDGGHGAWELEDDPTAADGTLLRHPDAGEPKLTAPLARPTNYVEANFAADPTQTYKLWLRLRADGNHWSNDSVFVQFEGATDANGHPVYEIGSTSALAVNLEECSGCGISGWGWEDDGWGAKNVNGAARLHFPTGRGRVRIQTREDGVSFDQLVLSSGQFVAARPGTAKNDTTIVPSTIPIDQ